MLLVKVYRKGNKIKSKRIVAPDGSYNVTNAEMLETFRLYKDLDIKFWDKQSDTYITYESLLNLMYKEELEGISKTNLNNVIRNGGLIKYTEMLENRC